MNVLLITADQFRGDFLGVAGHPAVRTPHLDALAREGLYFSNAFSATPICLPARYTLMTGRLPFPPAAPDAPDAPDAGRRFYAAVQRDGATLPNVFGRAGYATAAIGKMHFTPWHDPHGFETFVVSEEGRWWRDTARHAEGGDDYQHYLRSVGWDGYERAHGLGNDDVRTSPSPLPLKHYHTTWCARTTQDWLRAHVAREGTTGRPFFAWCSFVKPHSPYDPPEPYHRLYDPQTFPPPIGSAEDLRGLSPLYEDERRYRLYDSLAPQAVQRARACYAASVTLVDEMVGALRRTLEELGVAGRTAICFTADHGDLLGDHGLFFKNCFFQGSWHVPLMVYAPGRLPARRSVERFATLQDVYPTLQDVYPTLLALAGLPLPYRERFDGHSLAGDLDGGPDAVLGSVGAGTRQVHGMRTRRWRYAVYPYGAYEELYDLETDPQERRNLAEGAGRTPAAAEVLGRLRRRLEGWLAGFGDLTRVDEDGRFRLFPEHRGWTPRREDETGMSLRPY